MDNKYLPFGHPAFELTSDGKGTPYVHVIEAESTVIGATFEILTKRSVEYYEALKKKGENIYIDDLTYDEFMLIGDTELGKRFISMDEKAQKDKLQLSQNNELEYSEELVTRKVKSETKAAQQHQDRKALEGEDTITNRMLHWKYSKEQIAELKRAVEVKMPTENILEFFYPDTSTQRMREIVDTFHVLKQVYNKSITTAKYW